MRLLKKLLGLSSESKSSKADQTIITISEQKKVKNLNNTSNKQCSPCGSWLKHWSKYSGKNIDSCAAVGCTRKATVGAHVKFDDGRSSKHYIIPVCKNANNQNANKLYTVQKGMVFVPAIKCS